MTLSPGCGVATASKTLELAMMLDYRVLVCDPRPQLVEDWDLEGVEVVQGMPDDVVRERVRDQYSIVITLTHDPRIDDMALMEALASPACYVGALGSVRTSARRRERLPDLGLGPEQIGRLRAPFGLEGLFDGAQASGAAANC